MKLRHEQASGGFVSGELAEAAGSELVQLGELVGVEPHENRAGYALGGASGALLRNFDIEVVFHGNRDIRVSVIINGFGRNQMLTIVMRTDNAAFEDVPEQEAARVLERYAAALRSGDATAITPLHDINRNRIGSAVWMDD